MADEARVAQEFAEVSTDVSPVGRVAQEFAEVSTDVAPIGRVAQEFAEVIVDVPPHMRLAALFMEVFFTPAVGTGPYVTGDSPEKSKAIMTHKLDKRFRGNIS